MEFVIELLLDLIFDFGIEASKSSKVPKPIRILLVAVISILFTGVIGLIFLMGISILKDSIIGGIFIILLGVVLLVFAVVKFRKIYLLKKDRN